MKKSNTSITDFSRKRYADRSISLTLNDVYDIMFPMMNANNAYFENMERVGREYEEARAERKERKQRIIDTFGWESDELKAWYEEDEAAEFPFTPGACKAYRAWDASLSRGEDELEMDDFLWDREVADFIDALRGAGIETLIRSAIPTRRPCREAQWS